MSLIPFEITATNLNLADTANQEVHDFVDNAGVIRVPKYMLLTRKAGTAYTITKNQLRKQSSRRGSRHANAQGLNPTDPAIEFFFTNDDGSIDRRDSSLPSFKAPLSSLGFEGTVERGVLVYPTAPPRGFFTPNEFGSLVARSNVTISGGTGSLIGHFVFDEYPLV